MTHVMSELFESVWRDHVLGWYCDAEARLEGTEGAYLSRESDVNAGMFTISYVKSSSMAHILVLKRNGQSLEQKVRLTPVPVIL